MTAGPLPLDAAVRLILERLHPTRKENASLVESLGRTLAADVRANTDLPPWDNSAMDGYACRAADIVAATEPGAVHLPVVETIPAGGLASRALAAGEAMRIMTGAPLPIGADTVVRVEDTDGGTSTVAVRSARDAMGNVRRRGEDVRAGDTVLRAGGRIGIAEVAMLASVGRAEVSVHRRPRVAILASGDELLRVDEVEQRRSPSQIVSANSYSLAALVTEAGGEPVDLGIVADDLDAMTAAMQSAADVDLLLTSGGISVGGFDYTRSALEAAGGEILFWRVAMRPGYNSAFGTIGGVPWLGVPGNPVSALIGGEILARPAIRRLCGSGAPLRARRRVRVAERHQSGGSVTVVARVRLESGGGDLPVARSAGPQGSAILSSSVRADALLLIPAGTDSVEAGSVLEAVILRDEATAG